ncbi:MAG: HPr kinase/phosphorylase [Janthinobacterium lividum]
MQLHASCAAHFGAGVLLIGAPGSGKSDLLLRLLDHGFDLVADDQVVVEDIVGYAPATLAGLIEVRGLGIIRMPYVERARLELAVVMGQGERMPEPERRYGLPLVHIDPTQASAPARVLTALRCSQGRFAMVAGAFT